MKKNKMLTKPELAKYIGVTEANLHMILQNIDKKYPVAKKNVDVKKDGIKNLYTQAFAKKLKKHREDNVQSRKSSKRKTKAKSASTVLKTVHATQKASASTVPFSYNSSKWAALEVVYGEKHIHSKLNGCLDELYKGIEQLRDNSAKTA